VSKTSDRNERLALQRANVIRYLVAHPDSTSREIATALRTSPQIVGQVLHKGDEFRETTKGRWRAQR
jgi:DNA-binding MarR family transcriptional regulator